eukprot:1834762-Heterocapsa_arctica.AAC.1
MKERNPRKLAGLACDKKAAPKWTKPPTPPLVKPQGRPPTGVHDVQPMFGPLPLAIYAMLNKSAHAGSYPWGAACSNCGKECKR